MCPSCGRKLHWLEAAMNDCIAGRCVDCGVKEGLFRESGTGLTPADLLVVTPA